MKTRYRVLRLLEVNIVSACFIAALNKILGIPEGNILFMNVLIDYDKENIDKEWNKHLK